MPYYLYSYYLHHVIQDIDKTYIDALLEEAQKLHNDKYIGKACFLYAELYYSTNHDSMRIYMKKGEPYLLKNGLLEEAFRMRSWNIYALVSDNKNERILPEVQTMESWDIFILTNEGKSKQVLAAVNAIKQKARQMNYPEGSLMADLGLSNFYFRNGLEEEGIKLAEDILATMISAMVVILLPTLRNIIHACLICTLRTKQNRPKLANVWK